MGDQIILGRVGIDLDVSSHPECQGIEAYWIPHNLRYQYDGIPLYLAVDPLPDYLGTARNLMHETFHEFGETDEGIAEALANLCLVT